MLFIDFFIARFQRSGKLLLDHCEQLVLRVDVELAVDTVDVGLRRAVGDTELFLHIGGIVATREHVEHFGLP